MGSSFFAKYRVSFLFSFDRDAFDAHRGTALFVVRADEKLTAFLAT